MMNVGNIVYLPSIPAFINQVKMWFCNFWDLLGRNIHVTQHVKRPGQTHRNHKYGKLFGKGGGGGEGGKIAVEVHKINFVCAQYPIYNYKR